MERMTGLLSLSPRHFSWQPSARVSQSLRPFCLSHTTAANGKADEYWHLHRSHSRNILLCEYTTSPTLPTCEISLGLLTLPAPAAGNFVALILLLRRPSYGQKIRLKSSFFILNLVTRWKHVVSRPGLFASSEITAYTHCICNSVDSGQKDPFTYIKYIPDHSDSNQPLQLLSYPKHIRTPNSDYAFKFACAKHNSPLRC
jgi:hypothetical protein